ncbi:proton-associated sugar transporter A isoform X2 [Tribolium castaneum]|uniref:Membrane-associated transporter protein-like Protein n=1 Tax=Tribolium castaneum TaxID=7070 RepID=D6WAI6_TRICA|nr:Membrane-associated transporter protein-like Protein [Tribolium castaneum]
MGTEKLHEYEGFVGRLHTLRDHVKDRWNTWKDENPGVFQRHEKTPPGVVYEDYSHIYRRKTRTELIRISAAVMGIEFSYSAETAFVSPTLLKIGVEHKHMTLVWALSPLIGFFLTPILGSLSDRCHLNAGRRRPFIFVMSVGVLLGLLLVPNGELLGYVAGDPKPSDSHYNNSHPWGVFFTVLGTVLLDFDADACQSPARAYLLDVTVPEDHARGLSTFTVMAGLGGFLGYALGGINWDATLIGRLLGGHVRAVFTLTTLIFIVCVSYTITSFKEMPLRLLELRGTLDESDEIRTTGPSYGSLEVDEEQENSSQYVSINGEQPQSRKSIVPAPNASLLIYLKSIVYMPKSLKILCLTNLFCWMAHVCYSLYFTDFVGEAVFGGNPTGPDSDPGRELYESGVRFGCWGMSMYSLSCACYSLIIERLIKNFGARKVYVGGLLVYSSGMFLMALTKHKVGVIVFSWTAGVMYSTLFTMPYLLVAHYHASGTFERVEDGKEVAQQIRGLGTDVAIVSSMVFLAQFILSVCMGYIVNAVGTTTAVVVVASSLAFCGAITATQVVYLDL